MVSISEKKPDTSPNKLIQAVKELVEISQQILGPERDGFQMVKLQFPDGTYSQISRYINIRDDIYTAGYRDPAEIGLTIISPKGETLHLPRRGETVNEETIGHLRGFSEETFISLVKEIKKVR